MTRRKICAVGGGLVLGAAYFAVPHAWRRIDEFGTGIHQQSVTRSLAEWEKEYRQIHNLEDARRSIDMLEYVQSYYLPGPGYRSDKKTEAKLNAQRAQTVHAIVSALREFTGEDFGPDAAKWQKWAAKDKEGAL